jgi:hypothetical protein
MPRASDPGKGRIDEAAELSAAILEVGRDLESLRSRLEELAARAEAMEARGSGAAAGPSAAGSRGRKAPAAATETVAVEVRPLPELAMTAVAETALRGLSAVEEVVSVERFEGWARFTLEAVPGADLVSELREALPVAFRSQRSESGDISLDLKWAWGTGR